MAATNATEAFERVQSSLTQFKAVRRLLGSGEMITPKFLSDQLVEQVNIMVC